MIIHPLSYVFSSLFVVVSLIEIIAAFNELETLRKVVKPFSMFFLALAALITLPQHPLIYCGALLGMFGDILLINNQKRTYFMIGTVAFLLGHLCYISEILFVMMKAQPLSWWFYVVVAFSILLIVLGAYPLSKKLTNSRYLALLGNTYLSMLVLVTVVATIASFNGFANYMVLGILGGISFLASDLILTRVTFIKDFKRRDYYIMLFYLLGQAFIITGLSLTYIL